MGRPLIRPWTASAIVICLLGAGAVVAAAQVHSPLAWGPILGAVNDTSLALTWKTIRPVGLDIHYGEQSAYEESGTWDETLSYENHEGLGQFWLTGLSPGTTYRYQLVFFEGDAEYPTTVGAFRTLSPDQDTFSFAVYGATATAPDHHRWVAEAIRTQSDVDLVIHAGGLVDVPTDERFSNVFWAMSALGQSVPYLTVIGGRDAENELYYEAFAPPTGGGVRSKQWWSFSWGPVHFVGLDSTLFSQSEPEALAEQTAWLEEELQRAGGKTIVVFCADAPYSSSYRTGRNEPIVEQWDPLFRAHRVAVVFSSSIHCYEHIYAEGTHYVITGGGGAPLADPPARVASGTVFRRYGFLHYVRAALSEGTLTVAAFPVAAVDGETVIPSATGRPIDEFSVRLQGEGE
jgi:acid phosphatase type 7